jgi:hypothetical protein
MHSVVVNVTVNDPEAAELALREQLVPRVSHAPGLVTGYWTMKDNNGLTMLIFESQEAADAMRDQARSVVPSAMTLDGGEVREVVAHA